MDTLPGTRLLVRIDGNTVEENYVRQLFAQFGNLEDFNLIRDKGVAYVAYQQPSSALLALEQLDNGTLEEAGLHLRVEWAPNPYQRPRQLNWPSRATEQTSLTSSVSDNIPPRSRLFLVVPKDSDVGILQAELGRFPGCEYVKTDLVASKGICYAKYDSAAAAAHVLQTIQDNNRMVSKYKVKCMMADPKDKFSKPVASDSFQVHLPDSLYDNNSSAQRSESALSSTTRMRTSQGSLLGAGGGLPPPDARVSSGSNPSWLQFAQESLQAGHGGSLSLVRGTGGLSLNGGGPGGPTMGAAPPVKANSMLVDLRSASAPPASTVDHAGTLMRGLNAAMPPEGAQNMNPAHGMFPMRRSHPLGAVIHQPNELRYPRPNLDFDNQIIGVGSQGALGYGAPPGLTHGGSRGGPVAADGGYNGTHNAYGGAYQAVPGMLPVAPMQGMSQGDLHAMQSMVAMQQAAMGMVPSSSASFQGHAQPPEAPRQPELSRQRLYVVVGKSATEEQLTKLFRRFGGMEYCNLKKNKKTGQSKGYCFVNYSTPEAALAAISMLNGLEFPQGSGKNLKVMYSEVLTNRPPASQVPPHSRMPTPLPPPGTPTPPLHPSDSPILADGVLASRTPGLMQPRNFMKAASERHLESRLGGHGGPSHAMLYGAPGDSRGAQNVQDYHISETPSPLQTSSSGFGGSGGNTPSPPPGPPPGCPSVVYVHITKPLPPYALQYHFETCGPVETVKLHPQNMSYAMVKFVNPEHAANAHKLLNNTKMCGMDLTVERHDSVPGEIRSHFMSLQGKPPQSPGMLPSNSVNEMFPPSACLPLPANEKPKKPYSQQGGDHAGLYSPQSPVLAPMCDNYTTLH